MIRELLNRAVAVAAAAAAVFVTIVALGATVFYGLSLVLSPLGAAALTAGLFALVALITVLVFVRKAAGDDVDDDEDDYAPESLSGRLLQMVQQRPVIGIVAALAAGAVLLKKPGLAALALTVFTDQGRHEPTGRDHGRRRRRR